jgi:hypothetical protein
LHSLAVGRPQGPRWSLTEDSTKIQGVGRFDTMIAFNLEVNVEMMSFRAGMIFRMFKGVSKECKCQKKRKMKSKVLFILETKICGR